MGTLQALGDKLVKEASTLKTRNGNPERDWIPDDTELPNQPSNTSPPISS